MSLNNQNLKTKKPRDKFRFTIDSGLLVQLGEQLVSKPSIALAEVVKNSYDADAKKVEMRFDNAASTEGSITIKDNGHGMTFEAIRDS